MMPRDHQQPEPFEPGDLSRGRMLGPWRPSRKRFTDAEELRIFALMKTTSQVEIAKMFRCPKSTIRNLAWRARKRAQVAAEKAGG